MKTILLPEVFGRTNQLALANGLKKQARDHLGWEP